MDYTLNDVGVNNLIYAIISTAIKDSKSSNPILREDAIRFFESDYFLHLTGGRIDKKSVLDYINRRK